MVLGVSTLSPTRTVPVDSVADVASWGRLLALPAVAKPIGGGGLFDLERKRSLPSHPKLYCRHIALCRCLGDIQKNTFRRYPGLHAVSQPLAQDGAPASIVAAIERVELDGRASRLLLSRGGERLRSWLALMMNEWCERLLIVRSVITGGHQRDQSLADLVADACALLPLLLSKSFPTS